MTQEELLEAIECETATHDMFAAKAKSLKERIDLMQAERQEAVWHRDLHSLVLTMLEGMLP
jgi:hypothetical protein